MIIFANVNLLELGWMLMRMFELVCMSQNHEEPVGGRCSGICMSHLRSRLITISLVTS